MGLVELYHYYIIENMDPRVKDWWLISSPVPLILIVLSYLYFVLVCGPRYMKDRTPYSLKTFITYYNIFQIIVNAWLVYGTLQGGWKIGFSCDPVSYSWDPLPYKLAKIYWWTFLLKVLDFTETAIFVLKKNNRQVSFLHLYHHISTVILSWISVKYFAGGMVTFPLVLNCSVHVIMYTYYLLSTRGPRVRSLLRFIKPYITIIQMVQFCILIAHAYQAFLPSCNILTEAVCVYSVNLLINFYLFYDFYKKNYVKSTKVL